MTIPLRENRGETVGESDMEAGGPQHIAPICAWLASEESAGITSEIFHAARGGIAIMQQPRIIRQFKKLRALSLDELDNIVPQLMEAKKANMQAADESGKTNRSLATADPPENHMSNKVEGLHHLGLCTADMKSQIEFFTDKLGMELQALYWMHGLRTPGMVSCV